MKDERWKYFGSLFNTTKFLPYNWINTNVIWSIIRNWLHWITLGERECIAVVEFTENLQVIILFYAFFVLLAHSVIRLTVYHIILATFVHCGRCTAFFLSLSRLSFHSAEYDTKNVSAYYLSFVLCYKCDTQNCINEYMVFAYLFDAVLLYMTHILSIARTHHFG